MTAEKAEQMSDRVFETFTIEECQDLRNSLLATVYNETMMKLLILQRSQRLSANVPTKTKANRRASHALANGVGVKVSNKASHDEHKIDDDGDDDDDDADVLDETVLNALKFERDLEMLLGAYSAAYQDVCDSDGGGETCGSIAKHLEETVETLRANSSKDNEVSAQLQAKRTELNALKSELERQRTEGVARMRDFDERIAEAKHQLKCVHRVNELEYDLVERWEASRIEQASIWGENHERAYLCAIIDYKRRLADEQRMMNEVGMFRESKLAELQEKIAYWQAKYTREVNEMDKEIEKQEDGIAQLHKSLERHREVYEERVAYVHDYELKKAEEQRQHALQVHRIECAVRIQAWWRGTMVRRGLGPYKRKPKKGKKGKGKGK